MWPQHKACLAIMCAFLSMAGTVLAGDTAGNGMPLAQYEELFGLDPANPAQTFLDYDQDGLLNWQEAYHGTAPYRLDTDDDGWPDAFDNAISRARLDFNPSFIDGDYLQYVWPSWMVAAFKAGGEWETRLPAWLATRFAWYVPAGASGKLGLTVDRALLTGDMVLELEFYDDPNASLFVDLVNDNKEVLISSELVGNLLDGTGAIVRKAINIPLETYPEAVGILLRVLVKAIQEQQVQIESLKQRIEMLEQR